MFKAALISTNYFGANDTRTHVLSSALGGTVAVTLVAPIDVVKSRVQSSTGNVVSPAKAIYPEYPDSLSTFLHDRRDP